MPSLWDTITGGGKNASAEQLKRDAARKAAEEAAVRKVAAEEAARKAAEAKVQAIQFKRGGAVKKAAAKTPVRAKPAAKTKSRR